MKKTFDILTIVFISSIISLSLSSQEPQKRIIDIAINEKTSRSKLEETLKALSSKSSNDSLTALSKAFLLYKTDDYEEAVKIASDIPSMSIDDLKYFVIADSKRLLSEASPNSDKAQTTIRDSIRFFQHIILNYGTSPLVKPARAGLLRSEILLADHYLSKGNPGRAKYLYLNLLKNRLGEMTNDVSGQIYFMLGEAYLGLKQYDMAKKAYLEATNYKDQISVNKRLTEITRFLPPPKELTTIDKEPQRISLDHEEEKPKAKTQSDDILMDKAKGAFEKDEFDDASGKTAMLILGYPGSVHIPEAKNLFIKIVKKRIEVGKSRFPWGEHYKNSILGSTIAKAATKLDVETRILAASALYRTEFLKDTLPIMSSIVRDYPYSDFAPKAYLIISRIHRVFGRMNEAIEALDAIYERYGSSPLATYALFKKGMIYYEDKDYKKAQELFLRYIEESDDKSRGYFWLASAYERSGQTEKRKEIIERLRTSYPLSFYAVLENSYGHLLKLTEEETQPLDGKNIEELLTITDDMHFRRAMDFMSIGLLDFASYEADMINRSKNPDVEAYIAWLLNQSGSHKKAMWTAVDAASRKPDLLNGSLISIIFPKQYMEPLIEQSNLYGIDHLLLLSLIKQESAFDEDAVSSSGALGLMQIMPFTADEVSSKLLISGGVPQQNLKNPPVNISLATFYFYQLLKSLKGNAVYALASYNAGPARFKEWYDQGKNLSDMEFIEQIPVDETNQYVKNIIRNYIFYSYMVDKRLVSLDDLKKTSFYDSKLINQK